MCGGGGGQDAEREIRKQELAREQKITKGMGSIDQTFSKFDNSFYDRVRGSVRGVLMPQLNRQYQRVQGNLRTSMADRGLSASSINRKASTDLAVEKGMGEIAVENQAEGTVRETQNEVARQKGNITSLLISSANPTLAASQAVQAASMLSAPSIVAPIGNAFNSFAQVYLAHKQSNMYGDTASSTGGNDFPSISAPIPTNRYSA